MNVYGDVLRCCDFYYVGLEKRKAQLCFSENEKPRSCGVGVGVVEIKTTLDSGMLCLLYFMKTEKSLGMGIWAIKKEKDLDHVCRDHDPVCQDLDLLEF